MKILALEFSSNQRSVALWSGLREIAQVVESGQSGHARTRAFALLEELLKGDREVDLLAVGLGPGSYTGIRAAISIAQGWQLANNVAVAGVGSIAALALGVPGQGRVYLAVDAHRGEFYLASYDLTPEGVQEVQPVRLAPLLEVQALIAAGEPVYGPELPEAAGGGNKLYPTANAVAQLAATGVTPISAERLEPIYLRPLSFVKSGPRR